MSTNHTPVVFTHRGWFGICPVYLAGLDTDEPLIESAGLIFDPLLWISEAAYWLAVLTMRVVKPGRTLPWPVKVGEPLALPRFRWVPQ